MATITQENIDELARIEKVLRYLKQRHLRAAERGAVKDGKHAADILPIGGVLTGFSTMLGIVSSLLGGVHAFVAFGVIATGLLVATPLVWGVVRGALAIARKIQIKNAVKDIEDFERNPSAAVEKHLEVKGKELLSAALEVIQAEQQVELARTKFSTLVKRFNVAQKHQVAPTMAAPASDAGKNPAPKPAAKGK